MSMYRVYLRDSSFYDVKFEGDMHVFLHCGLNFRNEKRMVVIETTSGEVAISKELIVKVIKL